MHILDQDAPGPSEGLRSLSSEDRRRILEKACQFAGEAICGLELPTRDLLETISRHYALSDTKVAEAKSLAEAADEQYFSLKSSGRDPSEWRAWFCKARLLTAIAVGFGGESWNDAADAVYELCKSRDDPTEIIALVESGIEAIKEADAEG